MTITVRELREKLSKLPKHQIIEGTEGNAHFQVTKEESAKHAGCILYVVRVSGLSKDSRLTITSKFEELLGKPSVEFPAKALSDADSLYWDAKRVNQKAVD